VANSPAPDAGIVQFDVEGGAVTALATYGNYTSYDGGFTWHPAGGGRASPASEPGEVRAIADPINPLVSYRFAPGGPIEQSTDGGKSWTIDYLSPRPSEPALAQSGRRHPGGSTLAPVPIAAVPVPATGDILFAMGQQGALVRRRGGGYQAVAVGPYAPYEAGDAIGLLLGELLIAGLVLALGVASLAWGVGDGMVRRSWLVIGWLLVATLLWIAPPARAYGYGSAVSWIGLLSAAAMIVPLGIDAAVRLHRLENGRLVRSLAVAGLGAVSFAVPFFFWAMESLPNYTLAASFAFLLAGGMLLAGSRWSRSESAGAVIAP
jgi:hypothetical protein